VVSHRYVVVGTNIYLDVASLVGSLALLVATDIRNILLTDETISSIGICLCRALGLHLVVEGELKKLLGLWCC